MRRIAVVLLTVGLAACGGSAHRKDPLREWVEDYRYPVSASLDTLRDDVGAIGDAAAAVDLDRLTDECETLSRDVARMLFADPAVARYTPPLWSEILANADEAAQHCMGGDYVATTESLSSMSTNLTAFAAEITKEK